MNHDTDHVVLTRFNLPSKGPESYIRSREGWLSSRVTLFEQYCLPSIKLQTSTNFKWIIYFDPSSPEWLHKKIREWQQLDVLIPIYREEVSQLELTGDLRSVTGAKKRNLLTTNLDNDDGLAQDFVERLQTIVARKERQAIYFTHGLIKRDDALFHRKDRDNAFCSVLEEWTDAVTCWVDWHNRLADHMSTTEITGGPGWLQVIHDRNVSNRVHGRRVASGEFVEKFGPLIGDISDPNWYDEAKDRIWFAPRRAIYDTVRSVLKSAMMLIGGKPALDRMKILVQKFNSTK